MLRLLFVLGHQRSIAPAYVAPDPCPAQVNNEARERVARTDDLDAHLEEFMDKDTCFIYHRKVERAPILEEREVEELVVDREVVIRCLIVR